MSDAYLLLTPILMLGIVALLGFVGCDKLFGLQHIPDVLPPVTNLVATPGDQRVDLSWDAYKDATSYELQRGTVSGHYSESHEVDASQTTYADTMLTNGTTYFYVVTAKTPKGHTELSNEAEATPMQPQTGSFYFVTGKTLGAFTNTFNGWAGMEIQVGARPLSVTKVGRVFGTGNVQQHAIRIIDKGTMGILTTAILDTGTGTNGEFLYVDLVTPVTLVQGSNYYIVSREMSGGDHFYQDDTTIQPRVDAAVVSAVSGDGANPYVSGAAGNHCFGPLDFYYTIM